MSIRKDDPAAADDDDTKDLSEREMLIAKAAARIAIKEMTDDFYRQVGKGVVHKLLIGIGLAVVGFMAGKGYISFK